WENAKRACWAEGGFVTTVVYEEEADVLSRGLVEKFSQPIWIGLKKEGNEFSWLTGVMREFRAWDEGQPSLEPGRDCVVATHGVKAWRTADCTERHAFVCEQGHISPGGSYNNHGYGSVPEPVSWDEAVRVCNQLGGHLATI